MFDCIYMYVIFPAWTFVFFRSSKWKCHLTLYDANRQRLYDIWSKCCPIFCICCIDDINFYVSTQQCVCFPEKLVVMVNFEPFNFQNGCLKFKNFKKKKNGKKIMGRIWANVKLVSSIFQHHYTHVQFELVYLKSNSIINLVKQWNLS